MQLPRFAPFSQQENTLQPDRLAARLAAKHACRRPQPRVYGLSSLSTTAVNRWARRGRNFFRAFSPVVERESAAPY
jgi:hypothetical protein